MNIPVLPATSPVKICSAMTSNGTCASVSLGSADVVRCCFARDYEAIDELDRYEAGGIDDDEENDVELTAEQRRRAERDIKRREREKRRRLGQELNDESDFDDDDDDTDDARRLGLSSKGKRSRTNDDDIGMDDEVRTQCHGNTRSSFIVHRSLLLVGSVH
jgi:hypothetical protein